MGSLPRKRQPILYIYIFRTFILLHSGETQTTTIVLIIMEWQISNYSVHLHTTPIKPFAVMSIWQRWSNWEIKIIHEKHSKCAKKISFSPPGKFNPKPPKNVHKSQRKVVCILCIYIYVYYVYFLHMWNA